MSAPRSSRHRDALPERPNNGKDTSSVVLPQLSTKTVTVLTRLGDLRMFVLNQAVTVRITLCVTSWMPPKSVFQAA